MIVKLGRWSVITVRARSVGRSPTDDRSRGGGLRPVKRGKSDAKRAVLYDRRINRYVSCTREPMRDIRRFVHKRKSTRFRTYFLRFQVSGSTHRVCESVPRCFLQNVKKKKTKIYEKFQRVLRSKIRVAVRCHVFCTRTSARFKMFIGLT